MSRPLRTLHAVRTAATAVVLVAAAATPAAAQYRAAGSDIDVLPDRQEQLEEAVEQARWRLGALRISPWIGLRNVSYVEGERLADDGTGTEEDGDGDLTATVGAGLRLYVPMGKAILAAHALPEYSWYQDQDERNAVIGRYGVGFFGFFNRLRTEVTAQRVEDVDFLSPDLLVRQAVRNDRAAANAQVRLGAATALFVSGELGRARVDDTEGLTPAETSPLLDRDTTTLRGGVRYLLRGEQGHVGAGVQREETDFLDVADSRDNEGDGFYAEALLRGNRVSLALDYARVDLQPTEGSSFPGLETDSGRAQVTIEPSHRFQAHVYGLRELRYSALAVQRYFEEERLGGGLSFVLGRGGLLVFYEQGRNDFFGSGATTPDEDVTAYGATATLALGRYASLGLGSRQTTFEPIGGPDREVREVTAGLTLSLGAAGGDW